MTQAVKLANLQTDTILAFMRYTLQQNVTNNDAAWMNAIAGAVTSTPRRNHIRHSWSDGIEDVGEAEGAITDDTIDAYEFTRQYRKFGKSFRVSQEDRDHDDTGAVEQRIRDMSTAYDRLWARMLIKLIKDAAAGVASPATQAVDQVPLFSASHDTGSNVHTTNGIEPTTLTPAQAEEMLWAVVERIKARVDAEGREMNDELDSFVIMSPLNYMRQFAYAIGAQLIIDGDGSTRTNLLSSTSGMNFRLVSHNQFSAWAPTSSGGTGKFGVFADDGLSLKRAWNPTSQRRGSQMFGAQNDFERFWVKDMRLAMGWRSESCHLESFAA